MSEPSHTTETIERELAALGEAPPSAEELALTSFEDVEDIEDVANIARLAELAEPLAFDDLSELESHRSWRAVELRLARSSTEDGSVSGSGSGPGSAPSPVRSKEPAAGGPRRWLLAAVGIAAAAAVVLLVVRPFEQELIAEVEHTTPDAETVAQIGEQARDALKALDDGTSDTQRAERLAAAYQRQLEEQDG